MDFSEKLRTLRKQHGLSQEELAHRLGVSRQAVSKWENGQGFPDTDKLLVLSNMFAVSLDYLLK
ncbi:MAG TPA: helix-turn-helix transcriptional regulator, partial [Bacillota bacterium]|nr:helix-turn-helix transcriptional regulator [Bacillota bacterium]